MNAFVATTLATFSGALAVSLVITPPIARIARRRGLVDIPSHRKVHRRPIPRAGGVAIFLAFLLTCGGGFAFLAHRGELFFTGMQVAGLLGGGALIFGLGLLDDLRGLAPGLKFVVQIGVGLVAYFAGIGIYAVQLPGHTEIALGVLSLPATIFWFVLVINAINLIDGLDGLAAGVTVFSSIVLVALGLMHGATAGCVGLAALAGATLGFLRYNFNPASVFMGDCGSYFIGFALAALSILGSVKSQASVTILIPIIALGFPLLEAVWSGIRRFLTGHGLFQADKDHVHHRLLRLGYTHRRAVLVLYGFTVTLGILALVLVQASDRLVGAILVGLGVTMAIVIRRLGYVDYLTTEKFLGWARDLSDVIGVDGGGRTFLGLQVSLVESASCEELWEHLQAAARHLKMDSVDLTLEGELGNAHYQAELAGSPPVEAGLEFDALTTLRISMPVGDADHRLGCLVLAQRLHQTPPEYHVLRRMEHLRRATSEALLRLRADRAAMRVLQAVSPDPEVPRPAGDRWLAGIASPAPDWPLGNEILATVGGAPPGEPAGSGAEELDVADAGGVGARPGTGKGV